MTDTTVQGGCEGGITRRHALGFMFTAPVMMSVLGNKAFAQAGKPALNLAFGAEPNGFDAGRVPGGNDYIFFANVFEGLYGHDGDGKLVESR
jgi:hypothetical protein